MIIAYVAVQVHGRQTEPWFESRVSNYPRLQNDTENTCRAAFQPAHFRNAITNVLSCSVHGVFTICRGVLRGDPRSHGTGVRC